MIALLYLTQTLHRLTNCKEPFPSSILPAQNLTDLIHTRSCIFFNSFSLSLKKYTIGENITSKQHGRWMTGKKVFQKFQWLCFPRRIFISLSGKIFITVHRKDQNIVSLCNNIQTKLFCSFIDLHHVHGTADQCLKKIAAAVLLISLHLSLEFFVIFFLCFFMFIAAADFWKPFNQSILCDRFQEIILHPNSYRLFCIIKVIIST